MTDKQIIIDGVDVSKCEYWSGSELGYCNIGLWANDGTHICECEIDCLYKQLKRKEQECEELKDLNTRLDNQRETYWKEYQKLKQTLTEIKEIAEYTIDMFDEGLETGGTYDRVEQILNKISEVEDVR